MSSLVLILIQGSIHWSTLRSLSCNIDKFIGWHYLYVAFLSKQYMIKSLLNKHHSEKAKPYCMAIAHLISKQCLKIKSLIMDTNNHLNEVFFIRILSSIKTPYSSFLMLVSKTMWPLQSHISGEDKKSLLNPSIM